MNKLTIRNFLDRYIFNPTSSDLPKPYQKKALATTIVTGILTGGLFHFTVLITNAIRFKGKIIKKIPRNSSTSRTSREAANVFGANENPSTSRTSREAANVSGSSERSSTSRTSREATIVPGVNENKIRQELQKRGISQDRIASVISIIKEIVSASTICGQPIVYDEQNMAYLRKDEQTPFTLQVYTNGTERRVYIHLKSKAAGQRDLINQACQKVVYRTINQSGEVFATSVMHERFKNNNCITFETEKKALELFSGCPYILQGFHASSYPNKDSNKDVKYGLITEHCEGAAGKNFLNRLSLKERWTFLLHTLEGVKEMHDRGYCHFDLKSDNILYKTVDGVPEPRIIDFGVMHAMEEVLTSGARGAYLPPELRIHESFPITVTEKVDVWSLGQYAATEFLGVYFSIEFDYIMKDGKYAGKKPRLKADWSQVPDEMHPFMSIIQQMLNCNPDERISMDSAIEQIRIQLQKLP